MKATIWYIWWNKDINSVNNQRSKNSDATQWLVLQDVSLPHMNVSNYPRWRWYYRVFLVSDCISRGSNFMFVSTDYKIGWPKTLTRFTCLARATWCSSNQSDELSKTERVRKILKSKITVTYNKENILLLLWRRHTGSF